MCPHLNLLRLRFPLIKSKSKAPSFPPPPTREPPPPPSSSLKTLTNLLSLPPELHLQITTHLPLSSALALSLTSRHFRLLLYRYERLCTFYAFSPLIAGPYIALTTHYPPFARDIWELGRERDVFLSYVERDLLVGGKVKEEGEVEAVGKGKMVLLGTGGDVMMGRMKALMVKKSRGKEEKEEEERKEIWCSYCQDYHPMAMFTSGMVQGWRHERKCKGAEGKLWVCPHKAFSHQSVRDFTCSVGTECMDGDHEVFVNLDGVRVMRPVMFVVGGGDQEGKGGKVKYKDIRAAMKIRHVRICPHWRMSESMVYGAMVGKEGKPFFHVGRIRRVWGRVEEKLLEVGMDKRDMKTYERSKTPLKVMSSKRVCALCGTSWGFQMSADGRIVYLVMFRPFIHSHGVCHPAWYFQVALPDEFEDLASEWKMDMETFRTSPLTHFADFKGETSRL